MKYKLSVQKKEGFIYSAEDGTLKINETLISEPTDDAILEYDITEEETGLGISRCYREDGEVFCNLTLFVESLDPYKSGACVKDGIKYTASSKWDLSKIMTADEVINGNPGILEGEVEDV